MNTDGFFKSGDIVRCINQNISNGITYNKLYTVIRNSMDDCIIIKNDYKRVTKYVANRFVFEENLATKLEELGF